MDPIELLDHGYAWTAARIAAVPPDGLDAPTPCSRWTLEELLDHTIGSLTMLTDAVATAPAAGPDSPTMHPAGASRWNAAIAELADRSRQAWQAPGVMDRTFALPIGTLPAPAVASTTALEAVVHGWDISQASGEASEIPAALAVRMLEFARQAVVDANRGEYFAADLDLGETPSDRLVAFLGRKPR
jgi:uncharacterized protein (TIGR03086 family)